MPEGGPRLWDYEGEDGEEALHNAGPGATAAHYRLRQLPLPEQDEKCLHRVLHICGAHLAFQHVEDNVEEVEHLFTHLESIQGTVYEALKNFYILIGLSHQLNIRSA